MKRKIYNQPATEVIDVRIENLMLSVSNGGVTPPDEGPAHAPRRGGSLIPL